MVTSSLRAHAGWLLAIALTGVACAGADPSRATSAPDTATKPGTSSTAASTAPTGAASASTAGPAVNSTATAAAASATASTTATSPFDASVAARLRDAGAIGRVFAHAVDDACLLADNLPKEANRAMGSGVTLVDFSEAEVHTTAAVTNDDSPEALAAMRTFAAAFPAKAHRVAIGHGLYFDKPAWKAVCTDPEPFLAGGVDIGRIKHADGTFDDDKFRVGLTPGAMQKLAKLPAKTSRIAFVLDGDLLLVADVVKLKELERPAVTLAKLPAK